VTPKLYKAAEVCEMTQLQPYVLRSWEKEFPGIGVQKTQDGPRLYRQSDLDQVLRIKQLVFGEGLTLAGARRRLEDSSQGPVGAHDAAEQPAAAVPPERSQPAKGAKAASGVAAATRAGAAITAEARARVEQVRDGLRSILTLLAARPALKGAEAGRGAEEYHLEPPAMPKVAKVRKLTARRPAAKRTVAKRRSARV
jgi:DNA-binding transcriptional MerR regulator